MSARSTSFSFPDTPLGSASQTTTGTPQARNPVALRLYKVLGTSFNDDATKEALRTLSDLYATPSTLSGSLKGKEVDRDAEELDDDDIEDDVAPARPALGSAVPENVPGDSAAKARLNLRRDMENKLAEGSRQFLSAFGEVDQKLDELQEHITTMRSRCDEAETQLRLTDEASKSLLERAGSLREERQEVETRKSIVSLFLARFTLSEEEVEALTSRDVALGRRFFAAMDKTERIRSDCRVLMAGEDGPTKAGLDIMSSTSSHLEQGYEKIFRWCSYEFQRMGRDVQLEVAPNMREAVRRLRQRPELLTEALTFLSQTRQSTLLSTFLDALTRGGPSGLPRPIELHAHDPLRYVGDMLAWVHQAIAAEHEFLEGLFALGQDGRMVGSVRRFGVTEEDEWIRELMDSSVSKLCVPLKIRVQQTVRSQESSIISYKIANLLQFYMLTMRRTIGDNALLSTTLQEITDVAYKVFYDAIETQGRAMSRVPLDLNDPEVTPPSVILEQAQILREIMTVYESSLLGDEDPEERDAGFKRILDVLVDPTVDMIIASSEEKRRLRPAWDKAVFVLNCLSYLEGVLEAFSFTGEKRKKVQDIIEERVQDLIEDHTVNIFHDASMYDVIGTVSTLQPSEILSRLGATQPQQLQSSLHKFSLWLSGLEVVHSPRLARLTVQRLHTRIHREALERLARGYAQVCEEVRKPRSGYEAASTLLGSERPFGQPHLLWQIFGLEDTDTASG
ncbi:hypothetical protein PLICRDRAFT_34211 [Plicaturopsis crispa FD-325 SS-3]|nr:hypothetical protein PLICRDRAFT_34211 [Plicaturopsis crispa FD-325 SS-3]